MVLVYQNIINAYAVGDKEMHFQPGGLMVHLAGCWVDGKCEERWAELWNKREKLNPQQQR